MSHMSYPVLELIMLCKMYLNFESVDKIRRWIKPKLEREIAYAGEDNDSWGRDKERGKGEVGEG